MIFLNVVFEGAHISVSQKNINIPLCKTRFEKQFMPDQYSISVKQAGIT